jgi:long-chain acyl-CoA synthetase
MSPLIGVAEHIAQARQMDDGSPMLPWSSFADFFKSRVYDRRLVNRPFLTYYDDDRQLHCTYSYAEFGAVVERTAAVLHDRMGLTLGDRIATVLFNHDLAVILYFAAWTRGIAVVPINAEEPAEKNRYILEHSEASSVFCWHDYLNEIMSCNQHCRLCTTSFPWGTTDSVRASGPRREIGGTGLRLPLASGLAPLA